MSEPKSILFLDGMGCNPEGFKPRFLAGLGYRVVAPMLPDLDFPASITVAEAAVAEARPDAIVGYSRGAGVAMSLTDRRIPRVLIAPALRYVPSNSGFDGRLIILHSATDDSLPLEGVQQELIRCGLTSADLRIVGDDHTMIDTPALDALTRALSEVTS